MGDNPQNRSLPYPCDALSISLAKKLATYLQDSSITKNAIVERIVNAVTYLSTLPKPDDCQLPGPVSGGIPQGYIWSDCGTCTTFSSRDEMEVLVYIRLPLHKYARASELQLRERPLVMCHTRLAPLNIKLLDDGEICF